MFGALPSTPFLWNVFFLGWVPTASDDFVRFLCVDFSVYDNYALFGGQRKEGKEGFVDQHTKPNSNSTKPLKRAPLAILGRFPRHACLRN